ncbi:hypothetical protein CIB84_016973 [Bambusicola thoracicus]|uniref:Uncharacterized protein n=1 Tax=Bambusicola thoracicus TaxID=9083 RepID=A0A2P4S592_BAMTH|nr:hypothetical protein CIB84_016973 [Bambusicola thoracicus]
MVATSGGYITTSCPKRGTDSSSPASPCPHCSLTVPKLFLPYGSNGGGPHPWLVAGGSEQGTAIAPTLPVAAPQPGGAPGGRCHPLVPPAPHGCQGLAVPGRRLVVQEEEGEGAGCGRVLLC